MNTRMDKYVETNHQSLSRSSRNAELYKTINKGELENYEIKSNATVLGPSNKNQIDVDQIKKILDVRYNSMPKRKSIQIENTEISEISEEENHEITKEYDINAILEKARNEKPVSYEEERVKRLRDTQYDILNNLDLKSDEEIESSSEENKLLDLINTITINEDKNKNKIIDSSPLDILSDLKGDDNTIVLDGMKEEIEKEDTSISEEKKKIKLDNSFYTKSMEFNKKDFDDLEIENDNLSIWMKLIIVIIIIAFLVGVFFFLKSILNF